MHETELLYGGATGVRTERVIEKVEVIKPVYTVLPGIKAGICGLTAGAGATFAAVSLAGAVARMGISASITEMGESVLEEMAGEASQKFRNKDATVKLYDFSGDVEEKRAGQMDEMDRILVVIDPLPSKIAKGFDRFQVLSAKYDCIYAIGKMHKEVRKREIKKIFGIREMYEIPLIESEYVYIAEQKSILFSDICFVRNQLDHPAQKILQRILPPEVLKLAGHVVQ